MKKIIFFLSLFIFQTTIAQNFNKEWKEVMQFEVDGKTKSANELVSKIYKKASKKAVGEDIIRCFLYQSKYNLVLQEDAQNKILANLDTEIERANTANKAILNFIYADILQQYYMQNQYQIRQKKETNAQLNADFKLWTEEEFKNVIYSKLELTSKNNDILKTTSLDNYKELIQYYKVENSYENSIYSFLLERKINFFQQWSLRDYYYQSKNIKNSNLFYASTEIFIQADFNQEDKFNLSQLLKLLQEKERFIQTNFPKKLVECSLDRILLISKGFGLNEDYLNNLKQLENQTTNISLQQLIKAYSLGYLYSNNKSYKINETLTIAKGILKTKVNNQALAIAEHFKNLIEEKSLQLIIPSDSYKDQNLRAFIDYKNVDTIYFKYYKIPHDFKDFSNNENYYNLKSTKDSITETLKKYPLIKESFFVLPENSHFKNHSTEILLPKLELGTYFLEVSTRYPDNNKKYVATSQVFKVSDIAYMLNSKKDTESYQVFDKKSGIPLQNVLVKNKFFQGFTDSLGKVQLKLLPINYVVNSKEYNEEIYKDRFVLFVKDKDSLFTKINYYQSYEPQQEKEETKSVGEIYFDRAIYRPGQKVHFKVILAQKTNGKVKLVANTKFLAVLEDDDYKEIYSKEAFTNEFGSFSDSIVLPKNGLNGRHRLLITEADEDENIDKETKDYFWKLNLDNDEFSNGFSVEEYKRPTFYIEDLPITQNYKIGDSVSVKFNAKTFSGVPVSNATIKYSIEKNYQIKQDNESLYTNDKSNEFTIASDKNGDFEIRLFASDSLETDTVEMIDANLILHVTDSNGETQLIARHVNISKNNIEINIESKIDFFIEDNNQIKITTTNTNKFPTPTKGIIKFYEVLKKNYFINPSRQFPENSTISENEFKNLFPYEPFNANEIIPKEILIKTINFDTNQNTIIDINFLKKYKLGDYKIVVNIIDENNKAEETIKFITLNSKIKPNIKNSIINYALDYSDKKNIKINLFSEIKNLTINALLYFDYNLKSEKTIQLKNGFAQLSIPKEKYKDDEFSFYLFSFWEDQYVFTSKLQEQKLQKPVLEIETIHFKNKLEPNQKENWSFKISNSKLEAEVLASMYDLSLDKIQQDDWSFLEFRDYKNINFPNKYNYDKIDRVFVEFDKKPLYNLNKIKPFELNYFGFDFTRSISDIIKKYVRYSSDELTIPSDYSYFIGTIIDAIGPMPSVNVVIKGTTRGVATDIDGVFVIKAEIGETLIITFPGYGTIEYVFDGKNNITFTLREQENKLDEVVITAFGIKRETKKLAYSTQKVSSNLFNNDDSITTLQGNVSGLLVKTTNYGTNPNSRIILRGYKSTSTVPILIVIDGKIASEQQLDELNPNDILNVQVLKGSEATALYGSQGKDGVLIITTKNGIQELETVKTRTNFNETAFFYPELKTDKDGKVTFNFTTPESLTKWKLRIFAHNKLGESGYLQQEIVTQKQLSITPNMPRFVREKDTIILNAKISNLSEEKQFGTAILQFFDAATGDKISTIFTDKNPVKTFAIASNQTTAVSWKIVIPEGLQGLNYKIIAKTNQFSDGEENTIPVLANKTIVNEGISLFIKPEENKTYNLPVVWQNKGIKKHQLVLNFTNQPIWIILESIPYLLEYEHECSEQTFARYFAGILATEMVKSQPKIESVLQKWRTSNLPKSTLKLNEDLKQIALAETPWLLDAQTEEEKNKRLALLLELNTLEELNDKTFTKLQSKLLANGSFSWFDGGTENILITQYIVSGIGFISHKFPEYKEKFKPITDVSLPYLDSQFEKNLNINFSNLDYLFTRSYYLKSHPLDDKLQQRYKAEIEKCKSNWLQLQLMEKSRLALVCFRFGDVEFATKIITHLKETASNKEDFGMYWIANDSFKSYFNSSVSVQSQIIEAFNEITNDKKSIENLKTWMIRNKQTTHWSSTKSTTEALFALLTNGFNYLETTKNPTILFDNKKVAFNSEEIENGRIRKEFSLKELDANLKSITIKNDSKSAGFGGVYLSYFQNLEDNKPSDTNILTVTKTIFKKVNTATGEKLEIVKNNSLNIGDLVTIQIEIKATENLEFVHLKDLRASCFEPTSVLSGYEWKNNLSYYKTTKDVSTNFFIENLNKGSYILDYDVRVTNLGVFNDGIATIQSMYAPEITAHSASQKVKVD